MEVNAGIKRSATMVVLRHEHEFLLLRRSKPPYEGHYLPVGGKIEPHERPIEAALRETQEETGLQLRKEQLRYGGVLAESSPGDYNWICFIYLAHISRVPPPACDEGTLEWISLEQITDIPTPPTDWQIYQYLVRGQSFALDAVYNADMQLLEMREEISGRVVFPR